MTPYNGLSGQRYEFFITKTPRQWYNPVIFAYICEFED